MAYLTEQEAWQAAIRIANNYGRRGMIVDSIEILAPQTATQTYALLVGNVRVPTIDDVL